MLEIKCQEKMNERGLSQVDQAKLRTLERLVVKRKQTLEEILFETFTLVSENFKEIMLQIA